MALDRINATALLDGGVTTADIADDAVTTAKINAGAVDTTELADDAVTNAKIAAGAVDTTELASGAVTSAKLDTNIDVAGTLDITGATTLDSTLAVAGHSSIGNAGTVAGTRALTVVGATDGTGSSIIVGYNSSLSSKFGVRDDGYTTIGAGMNVQGNITFASGAGIDFSGNANASGMTSELLDDYEEGTWTPAWANGSGQTYTYQYGTYVKIGRQVTVTCFISTSSMNGQTGDATIAGLPFTASTDTFSTLPRAYGNINGDNNWDTNLSTNNLVSQINGGGTTIVPRFNSGSNTGTIQLQHIGGGGSYFGTTITYETDS